MSLYQSLERNFFNSLTRKIVGNITFLLLPYLVLGAVSWYYIDLLGDTVAGLALSANQEAVIHTVSVHMGYWFLGILLFAIAAGIFTILFLRHLILRPIRDITTALKAIKENDGDISATLPTYTHDEIADMAMAYNEFSNSLKRMIEQTRQRSVEVALSATRLQKMVYKAFDSANAQQEKAEIIFNASENATHSINDVVSATSSINDQNSRNMVDVRTSGEDLLRTREQVRSIRTIVGSFQDTVERLSKNSDNVTRILSMVRDFSDQTNLLALNASIEAARAGEAGRGFSVVADEVRSLSLKVSDATSQIDGNISEMSGLVHQTRDSARDILSYIEDMDQVIDATTSQFQNMIGEFDIVSGQLTAISGSMDDIGHQNHSSHESIEHIRELSGGISSEMSDAKKYSDELELCTEKTQELLSRFIIGSGQFEAILLAARRWSNELSQTLQQLASEGINIFDRRYQRLNEGQLPEKYKTQYTERFAATMQPLYDRFSQETPELIYSIAVDVNGYAAAHHARVSAKLTGDFAVDNLKSRHCRIFNGSRAEVRRAKNTAPFLLQTFIRDTGEILNDLSIPLYVNNQHWGALIIGFDAKLLLKEA